MALSSMEKKKETNVYDTYNRLCISTVAEEVYERKIWILIQERYTYWEPKPTIPDSEEEDFWEGRYLLILSSEWEEDGKMGREIGVWKNRT